VRSTTFLFTTWCTLVAKFRDNHSQTLPVRHIQADLTPPALQRARAPAPSWGRLFPRPGALRGALKSSPATCRVFPRRSATPPWTAGPFPAELPAPRTACCPRSGPRPSPSLFSASQRGCTTAIKGAPQGVPARLPFHGPSRSAGAIGDCRGEPGF
jgi:hypothetical protein